MSAELQNWSLFFGDCDLLISLVCKQALAKENNQTYYIACNQAKNKKKAKTSLEMNNLALMASSVLCY